MPLSERLEWSATYVSEKSSRAKATASTTEATSVDPNAPMSAFRAESASRRRPSIAAATPATSA